MPQVRLLPTQVEVICQLFKEVFAPQDHLWLFGSRVNPEQKGGDIDLYVETSLSTPQEILDAKYTFLSRLKLQLGDQKIDLVIKYGSEELPIYGIAKREGVQLL